LREFFRRLLTGKEAPSEAAPSDHTTEPAPGSPGQPEPGTARPKRRRGTRGGRGRRKRDGETTTAESAASPAAKPERKPAAGDRRPSDKPQRGSRRRMQPKRGALPPAKRELLVSVEVSEQRVAVLEDGKVAEVYLERPERRSIAGSIYLGHVDNVLPGMEAAFVEIGLEKNGFLYVDEIVVPELEGKRHGKKIQDLLSRGQTILVQAVKDPMKTKGARLTTEISLPGRFVVFVPQGEGLGVSRRLPDDERSRLKEIVKNLEVDKGGVIVRTAAEGASAEDIERDVVFLQRLWRSIQARAKEVAAPALVYQEAELPLRVVRDLLTGDFEKAYVDHERTHRRIVGFLKKTSPHLVERVERYKEKTPLMEAYGVDAEVRSTLSRRVDLPSGGYLIFDYAEAFTVIDVNTGRFVGSRSKSGSGGLEDTITKNNLEAVREVVRQLRLRDIGGIIVIDFIDMANPKNRGAVEEALRTELERDRTKTYVVEISPLGLVEMTRQNVAEGPREILSKPCPTCGGEGTVVSDVSHAVDAERRLRELAAGSRARAFRVELHPHVASLLVGGGASRLVELEEQTRRRFFLEPTPGTPHDHFVVAAQGKVEEVRPQTPVEEGAEIQLKLVQVGLHDSSTALGTVDGYEICVADAAALVGKTVKVRVERALGSTAYATRVDVPERPLPPITAESEAEKPTRRPPARKARKAAEPEAAAAAAVVEEADETADADEPDQAEEEAGTKEGPAKRRRRGGRGRRRSAAATADAPDGEAEIGDEQPSQSPTEAEPGASPAGPRIHVPGEGVGREPGDAEAGSAAAGGAADAAEADAETTEGQAEDASAPKRRTRRGTRGGRGRRKKAAAAPAGTNGDADDGDGDGDQPSGQADGPGTTTSQVEEGTAAVEADTSAPADDNGDRGDESEWEYVPMSEWEDDLRP
jgi:ribonuclease G